MTGGRVAGGGGGGGATLGPATILGRFTAGGGPWVAVRGGPVVVAGGGGGGGAVGVTVVAHVGLLIVSWMNVTSALRARTLPSTVMFSVSVICVSARIVPMKVLSVFLRNAELTFQKTLQGWAPFV